MIQGAGVLSTLGRIASGAQVAELTAMQGAMLHYAIRSRWVQSFV